MTEKSHYIYIDIENPKLLQKGKEKITRILIERRQINVT